MRDWIHEQEGCAKVHVCVYVCVWACTDLNVTWERACVFWNSTVRNCVYACACFHFILCVCVCVRECELVCVCSRARGRSHISLSPGDDAKNMWLLKPSGVWAASVCSPLLSLWPSLPSVTPVPSIPPSITPSSKHSTSASAHTHQLHPAVSLLHFHWGWPLLSQSGIKRGEWKGGKKFRKEWRKM